MERRRSVYRSLTNPSSSSSSFTYNSSYRKAERCLFCPLAATDAEKISKDLFHQKTIFHGSGSRGEKKKFLFYYTLYGTLPAEEAPPPPLPNYLLYDRTLLVLHVILSLSLSNGRFAEYLYIRIGSISTEYAGLASSLFSLISSILHALSQKSPNSLTSRVPHGPSCASPRSGGGTKRANSLCLSFGHIRTRSSYM